MLLVIIGHVCVNFKGFQKTLYAFHMPLFFVVSGMTFQPDKYASFAVFVKNKIKKIAIPYLFLNMLVFPLWIYIYAIRNNAAYTVWDLLLGTLYGNVGLQGYNLMIVSGATWFLTCLFSTELLAWFCKRIAKDDNRFFFLLISLCGVLGILHMQSVNKNINPAPWKIQLAFTGVVFFGAGYLLMQYIKKQEAPIFANLSGSLYWGIILFIGVIGLIFEKLNSRVSLANDYIGSPIYFYIASFLLSGFCILVMMKVPYLRLLTYVGQNTIVWLAFHTLVMRLFTYTWPQIQKSIWLSLGLSVFLFVGITPLHGFFKDIFQMY